MNKQIILLLSGIILVMALYFFGKTVSEEKPVVPSHLQKTQEFDIHSFIAQKKENLSPFLSKLFKLKEDSVSSSTDSHIKADVLISLAELWRDSTREPEIYAHYISEASKLDNSEKSLTFAGQIFLGLLRSEQDQAKMEWESKQAISLFQKAIENNPVNDDLKINLASCYIYGKGRTGDPNETMKGIQELLGVVKRDSTNMKAQLMLGVGGYVSGQYDKAIARLTKVVLQEPGNLEAVAFLADTYAAKGSNEDAVKWYKISKTLANNEEYSKEVDERIKQLEKNN